VVPTIPTLLKLASIFEVSLSDLVREELEVQAEPNLPLLEKVKRLDELDTEERDALLKLMDMALSKKRMKDNLSSLIAG